MLGAGASDEEVNRLRAVLQSVSPAVLAARLREVIRLDVSKELKRIRVPILYLAGRRDRLVPVQVLRELVSLRPDINVVTLDAPHMLLQSRPAEAVSEIVGFLKKTGQKPLA